MESPSFLYTLFYFLVAIGVLVSFHEFGHFWVARKLGVKVLRFSIGFGKVLWRYQKTPASTEYVIAAIPLGGYVKMLDERMDPVEQSDLPFAFNRQPLWSRSAIVLAGPLFNLILAVLLYWAVFFIGDIGIRPVIAEPEQATIAARAGLTERDEIMTVSDKVTPTWSEVMGTLFSSALSGERTITVEVLTGNGDKTAKFLQLPAVLETDPAKFYKALGLSLWSPTLAPVIGKIVPEGPAEKAGLAVDDYIVSANGTPISKWMDVVDYVKKSPGKRLQFVIERGGMVMDLAITPDRIETASGVQGKIGAGAKVPADLIQSMRVEYTLPPLEGFLRACDKTYQFAIASLKMVGFMVVGNASVDNLSGPLTIAQYAGQSADLGLVHFLKFLAVVSVSLGVLNLLPIPVLDGGHLMFYAIEAIKGSPVSERIQIIFQQFGFVVLLSLMALAVMLDIQRLFS
ncbi:MAG TPA: RIP metalloprotease RseP [Methylococcales bacterium]|nr:RIP metalloprotease RseP [Methylococcales bacterium]